MALAWLKPDPGQIVYSECPPDIPISCEQMELEVTPPQGLTPTYGYVHCYDIPTSDLHFDFPLSADEMSPINGSRLIHRDYWPAGWRDTTLTAEVHYSDGSVEYATVTPVRIRSVIVDDITPEYLVWKADSESLSLAYTITNTKYPHLKVSVTIFDVRLTAVRHLLADSYDEANDRWYSLREPGTHEETWDGLPDTEYSSGDPVPTGVYFFDVYVEGDVELCHAHPLDLPFTDQRFSTFLEVS